MQNPKKGPKTASRCMGILTQVWMQHMNSQFYGPIHYSVAYVYGPQFLEDNVQINTVLGNGPSQSYLKFGNYDIVYITERYDRQVTKRSKWLHQLHPRTAIQTISHPFAHQIERFTAFFDAYHIHYLTDKDMAKGKLS